MVAVILTATSAATHDLLTTFDDHGGSRLILAHRSYTRPHKIFLLNVRVTQRKQEGRTISTVVGEFQRCEIPSATIDSTRGRERPRLHSLLSDPKVGTEISKTATASRLVKIVFPRT